jgi:hypothetical protein
MGSTPAYVHHFHSHIQITFVTQEHSHNIVLLNVIKIALDNFLGLAVQFLLFSPENKRTCGGSV